MAMEHTHDHIYGIQWHPEAWIEGGEHVFRFLLATPIHNGQDGDGL